MTQEYRGGNSRTLAKSLDLFDKPMAILDRRGVIVYVNSALCKLAAADSTELVGQTCSWQVAADATHAAILTALAPPAGALQGKIVSRQLSVPIVFGSTATGQLFLPFCDDDHLVHLTIVVLGDWQDLHSQFADPARDSQLRHQPERALLAVRSKWKTLDGLIALVGDSPMIELAMSRAQLAIATDSSVLVTGPQHVGKMDVLQGIFLGRLKRVGQPRLAGQLFPLDCSQLDADLFAGMLEVFAGRLRQAESKAVQMLVLQRIDALPEVALQLMLNWLESEAGGFAISATSLVPSEQLRTRGSLWQRLLAAVSAIEINVGPLCERRQDILPLAQHIMSAYCKRTERAQLRFAPDALALLTAFPWPNNLAQLTSAVEDSVQHAVLSATIQASHLPVAVRTFPSSAMGATANATEPIDLDAVLLDLEKTMLRRALKLSPRNRAQAARLLGISRPRLLRRIEQLGLGDETADDKG
ncbi:MAG: helix-turn-helix domain-containing protein [Pirellulaceae bacterium]